MTTLKKEELDNRDRWYWEVNVLCPNTEFDLVSGFLFDLKASGIEEVRSVGSMVEIKIYFPSEIETPQRAIQHVNNVLGNSTEHLKLLTVEKKPFENWQSNWRKFFKPIHIGTSFLVRPPWEKSFPTKQEIVIYPGLGFGTGFHESTNLMLRMIEWINKDYPFTDVIDVGAGSGILSIASLLRGAKRVLAVEIDPASVEEIPRNMRLSGVNVARCEIRNRDIKTINENAGLVLANIEGVTLIQLAKELQRITRKRGYLILSGILTENRDVLLEAFLPEMTHVKEEILGEWYSCVLRR